MTWIGTCPMNCLPIALVNSSPPAFFLLYGRDPRLPVDSVLSPFPACKLVNLKEYGIKLANKLSATWGIAITCIKMAQRRKWSSMTTR